MFFGSAVFAQQDPVIALRNASAQIDRATAALAAAAESDNQVVAVSDAIRSLEDGLSALRFALVATKALEAQKQAAFSANRIELGRLLAVLERIENSAGTLSVLHPGGATDSVRAGMILSLMTPELRIKANALRSDLMSISALNDLHEAAMMRLKGALEALQEARNQLAVAVREDKGISQSAFTTAADIDNLLAASGSLDELLLKLSDMQVAQGLTAAPRQQGQGLDFPVLGLVTRHFNQPNRAGIRQPGLVITAPALALVQAPQAGIVRFTGDFMEYGRVVILEPSPQSLHIYAGFGQVFVKTGDVLESGAAIGLLGGDTPDSAEFLAEDSGENDKANKTLYIEIRENGMPVDPELVFTRQ